MNIVVGDLHGRDCWKTIDIAKYDRVIFIGDYVDAFDISDADMFHNLKDLVQLKIFHPEKIILLWGNHDFQYFFLHDRVFRCTGFRPSMAVQLNLFFQEHHKLFQIAHYQDETLFTHAGISFGWLQTKRGIMKHFVEKFKIDPNNYSEFLRMLVFSRYYESLGDISFHRGGSKEFGSPLWASIIEHKKNKIKQVFGHTPRKDIMIRNNFVCVDCLGTITKFYEF